MTKRSLVSNIKVLHRKLAYVERAVKASINKTVMDAGDVSFDNAPYDTGDFKSSLVAGAVESSRHIQKSHFWYKAVYANWLTTNPAWDAERVSRRLAGDTKTGEGAIFGTYQYMSIGINYIIENYEKEAEIAAKSVALIKDTVGQAGGYMRKNKRNSIKHYDAPPARGK